MTISDLICELELLRTKHGDVKLWQEYNDGHATYGLRVDGVEIKNKIIWKGHSQPAHDYISFKVKY